MDGGGEEGSEAAREECPPPVALLRRWVAEATETNEVGCRLKIIFRIPVGLTNSRTCDNLIV